MASYIKKCPECGSINLNINKERGEIVCRDCGLVVEERMIDFSQEWREFESDQEKRRRTGAPATYSVDAAEPLILKHNNTIEIVKIGEFIDSHLNTKGYRIMKEGNVEFLPLPSGYEAVSFTDDYKISFQPISEISRHPAEQVYDLRLETGKRIKVTGSHSVFTVRGKEVVPAQVSDLKEGDFVVAPAELPFAEQTTTINLIEAFANIVAKDDPFTNNIYIRNIPDQTLFVDLKARTANLPQFKGKIKDWKRHQTLPLWVIKELQGIIDITKYDLTDTCIGTYSGHNTLPLFIKITPTFSRLLGWYASEGDSGAHALRFSLGSHETTYLNEIETTIKNLFGFGVGKYTKITSAVQLEIPSKLLSLLFSRVLKAGSNAHTKRVPPIIFNATKENRLAFLQAYIEGDGTYGEVYNTIRPDIHITTSSVNPDLSNDILNLYSSLGLHAHYAVEQVASHTIAKMGYVLPASVSTKTIIKNPNTAQKLGYLTAPLTEVKGKPAIEHLMPAPEEYKKEWKLRSKIRITKQAALKIAEKYNDHDLKKLAQAPFLYVRVRSITPVQSTNGYAYDIAVPGCENFVGGTGSIFLHNTRYDRGMGTDVGQKGDIFQLKGKGMNKFFRLRKWQYRISTAIERNLKLALAELKRVASYLKLPKSVEEEASRVYTMAVQRGLVRGRSMESVVAGALYAACRRHEVPRTLDELSEASGVDKKEVGRTYRFITRELGIRILPSNPVDYIPRFASALKLTAETQSKAVEILEQAENSELTSGRGPTGIAAASLYVAALINNEKRTQREVADVAGVTEVTIRNRYKELFKRLKLKPLPEQVKKEQQTKKR